MIMKLIVRWKERSIEWPRAGQPSADWLSAIRQMANLRYLGARQASSAFVRPKKFESNMKTPFVRKNLPVDGGYPV
jgi:hypothetical protein